MQLLRDRFTIDKPRQEWRVQFLDEMAPLATKHITHHAMVSLAAMHVTRHSMASCTSLVTPRLHRD